MKGRLCGAELYSEYVEICPSCGMPVEGIPTFDPSAKEADMKSAQNVSFGVAAVGLLLTLMDAFLPFFHVSSVYATLSHDRTIIGEGFVGDVVVICIMCAVGGMVIFFERRSSGIRQIVVGVMIIAAAILEYFGFKNRNAYLLDMMSLLYDSLRPGVGFYLMLAGGMFLIIAGFVMIGARKGNGTRKKK